MQYFFMYILTILMLLTISTSIVLAGDSPLDVRLKQNNNQTEKGRQYQMETMTVTGTAVASVPFETPSDIDVLSGREKRERQRPSLGQSLSYLPGIDSITTGSQAGKPVIRGLSGNRIQILQDGIGVYHQQYGTRHSPNIDPFLAERIEVVQGVSSILYGSNAIGGVINIIPRTLEYAPEDEYLFTGRLSTGFASNNEEWKNGLEFDAAFGHLGLTGAMVYRNSGDIEVPDTDTSFQPGIPGDNPRFDGRLDHTDFEQFNGVTRGGYKLDFGEITGRYEAWRNEHNFLLPDGSGIGQNLENDLVQLAGELTLGDLWTVKPIFTYSHNLRQSNAPGDTLPLSSDPPIDIERDMYTGRLEFKHKPAWLAFQGRLGIELVEEKQESKGKVGLTPGGSVSTYSVFALESRKLGPLTFEFGLRFDHREQEADPDETLDPSLLDRDGDGAVDVDLDNTYDVPTGSFGLVYRLTDHIALAANVARGFRAPDLFELYVNGVHGGVAAVQKGDPDLDPETSVNSDFSLRWRSNRVRAKATLYRNEIQDYIFLRDTGQTSGGLPVLELDQKEDAVLYGGNFLVEGDVTSWLNMKATYEAVTGEFQDSGDDLPLLPADTMALEARLYRSKLAVFTHPYFRVGVTHTFSQDAAGEIEPFGQYDQKPFGTASTDSYTLTDIEAGFHYKSIGFLIAVDNIFDEEYRNFLDTYKGYALGRGRNVRLNVEWEF